jgi:hypothetical protein
MTLRAYNWEHFERSKRWYVFFALLLIIVIGLSLWKKNIIGVVVLFIILGAYFYYSILSQKVISLTIKKDHLLIDNKIYLWSIFSAYSLELDKKTQKIRNLVLIGGKWYLIYTIHDTNEHSKAFLTEISEYLPLVSDFEQSKLEKITRILKL